MIFTRSANGLNNIHLFYGVEVMVYVEGENNHEKFDKEFYETIFSKLLSIDSSKYEIVPMGGCSEVKQRYEDIVLNNISNSICILDKDYNFIKQSLIYNPKLLKFTYGYSWESDFWSDKIIYRMIEMLSGKKISRLNNFKELIGNTKNYAKKVSCYDLVSQIHAQCVLDKAKSSFGIRLDYDTSITSLISIEEVKRIRGKIPNDIYSCSIAKDIYQEALKIKSEKLIQGHFWQKISLVLIIQVLKKIGIPSTTISDSLIFNLAKTVFTEDVNNYMDNEVQEYYLTNFRIC